MGWDVVQIGLRHNLPVESPRETAKVLAERMNQNVCLAYRKDYDFNGDTENLDWSEHFDLIEIEKFNINDSNDCIYLTITGYQANLIKDCLGIDKIRELAKYNETAESILSEIGDPFWLYEIEDKDDKLSIQIFKENVSLDVTVIERWFNWARKFENPGKYRDYLKDYRMKVYEQAKIFGCNEVIHCADQGPTMAIYDNADYSADDLIEYVRSQKYIEDSNWLEPSEVEKWKKDGKQIKFVDFFENKVIFKDGDFLELIIDDFKDLKN